MKTELEPTMIQARDSEALTSLSGARLRHILQAGGYAGISRVGTGNIQEIIFLSTWLPLCTIATIADIKTISKHVFQGRQTFPHLHLTQGGLKVPHLPLTWTSRQECDLFDASFIKLENLGFDEKY